jgi:hypothetical protein
MELGVKKIHLGQSEKRMTGTQGENVSINHRKEKACT